MLQQYLELSGIIKKKNKANKQRTNKSQGFVIYLDAMSMLVLRIALNQGAKKK